MDKTFAETRGEKPFDFNRFIDRAELGETTAAEHAEALHMALRWPTCACGNQCAIIPRCADGLPMDYELAMLGVSFPVCIELRLWRVARDVLGQIEVRSAALIAEELTRLNREGVSA